jgi:hypothetical protein
MYLIIRLPNSAHIRTQCVSFFHTVCSASSSALSTRAKPHKCPEYFPNGQKCDFSTADPSSLHRHRKRKHGYAPRPKPIGTPRAYRAYVPRREAVVDGDDMDAEGEPVSECESEESFGHRAEGSNSAAPVADDGNAGEGGAEEDGDQDGEGEPEHETEPVQLSPPPSQIMNVSSERTEPPPTPDSLMSSPVPRTAFEHPSVLGPPVLGLALDPPAPVFANISDTRTYVDAQ